MNAQEQQRRRRQRDLGFLEIAGLAPAIDSRVGVLAVIETSAVSKIAIDRAASLARSLDCGLQVVGAVAPAGRAGSLSGVRARFAHAIAKLELDVTPEIEVRAGSVKAVSLAAGLERRPAIVVVGSEVADGLSAVAIANALETPVLVARARRAPGPIVAATNMTHLRYPVLAAAAWLARCSASRAAFVHTATPYPLAGIDSLGLRGLAQSAASAKLARLRALASWAGTRADAVVVRAHSVSDTIVGIAENQDADVVSIGSRRRSWFERLGNNMAVEIVERCACSVLVVPVEPS